MQSQDRLYPLPAVLAKLELSATVTIIDCSRSMIFYRLANLEIVISKISGWNRFCAIFFDVSVKIYYDIKTCPTKMAFHKYGNAHIIFYHLISILVDLQNIAYATRQE